MITAQNSPVTGFEEEWIEMPENRKVTYDNVRYAMLVEVLDPHGVGGYHAGCKVHFFNRKGVLVGNIYQFLPYKRLRLREGKQRQYPRYFMGENYLKKITPLGERIKTWVFIRLCNVITTMIKFTQQIID